MQPPTKRHCSVGTCTICLEEKKDAVKRCTICKDKNLCLYCFRKCGENEDLWNISSTGELKLTCPMCRAGISLPPVILSDKKVRNVLITK